MRQGATLEELAIGADGVKVRCAGDVTIEARHLVAADGHWSTVRRQLHPDEPRDLGTWHAARQYFDDVDDERLWVLFEEDLLPGYAWVFPMPGGGANVGFGVLRAGRHGRELKELWADVLAPTGDCARSSAATRTRATPVRAWPIPTAYSPARLADGPVLYAGDAAAVVDPLTGEGIAQALETGIAAADAIAAGGDTDTVAPALPRHRRPRARSRSAVRGTDSSGSSRHRGARARRSRPPTGPTGPAAASPGGCSRGIRARCSFTPDRWHRRRFTAPGAFCQTPATR